MRNFFLKLNTRQLNIHFIATWFFTFSFRTLASLYDYHFMYTTTATQSNLTFDQRHEWDVNLIGLISSLGLIIAYIISWQISLRKNWYWANSVIVFAVAFAAKNLYLLGWDWLQNVVLAVGNLVGKGSMAAVIINGVYMLAFGCFLFFKKGIINYIDRGAYKVDDKTTTAKISVAGKKK